MGGDDVLDKNLRYAVLPHHAIRETWRKSKLGSRAYRLLPESTFESPEEAVKHGDIGWLVVLVEEDFLTDQDPDNPRIFSLKDLGRYALYSAIPWTPGAMRSYSRVELKDRNQLLLDQLMAPVSRTFKFARDYRYQIA
jgi:hypothetical protein